MAAPTSSLVVTPQEGWSRLSEFGSPLSLLRLVSELQASDRALGRRLHTIDDQLKGSRDQTFMHCFAFAWTFMEILSMRRIARRFGERMAMPAAGYRVPDVIDQSIARVGSASLSDWMIDVAQSCRPSDFSARVLRGRMRELSGDVEGSIASYDPGTLEVGAGAFEVFRRAQWLRQRDPQEAERLLRLALEAEPRFSLAYRAYADSIRWRKPQQAAEHYLAAMEHMPLLHHGGANAATGFPELRVLGSYRNFLLAMKGKTYIAYPAASGEFDLSSNHLVSPARRLAGLFLLRLRFRNKATLEALENAPVPPRPPWWQRWRTRRMSRLRRLRSRYRPSRYFNLGRVTRFGDTPVLWIGRASANVLLTIGRYSERRVRYRVRRLRRSARRAAVQSVILIERGRRLVKWRFAFQKRAASLALIGWAGRNYHLFQFILMGDTLEDLKSKIDLVYDRWLSTVRSA